MESWSLLPASLFPSPAPGGLIQLVSLRGLPVLGGASRWSRDCFRGLLPASVLLTLPSRLFSSFERFRCLGSLPASFRSSPCPVVLRFLCLIPPVPELSPEGCLGVVARGPRGRLVWLRPLSRCPSPRSWLRPRSSPAPRPPAPASSGTGISWAARSRLALEGHVPYQNTKPKTLPPLFLRVVPRRCPARARNEQTTRASPLEPKQSSNKEPID